MSEAATPSIGARIVLVPLLGVLWGLNWPAVRTMLFEIRPWTLRTLGMGLAGLGLVLVARALGRPLAVPRVHWPRLLGTGLLSIAAFNIFLAFAQLTAPTSRAAIVAYTMPVWAAILAWAILGERFDRRRLSGLALGMGGLAALGLPLLQQGTLSWGLLLALLGGFSWAAGTVLMKRFRIDAPALTIAAWQLLLGAVAAGIGMLAFEGLPRPEPLATRTIVALLYHVILAQALAYYLWFELVPRLPAGVATIGTLMAPAVGVLGATTILGERPTATDILGLVLVVAAAATILLPARAKA